MFSDCICGCACNSCFRTLHDDFKKATHVEMTQTCVYTDIICCKYITHVAECKNCGHVSAKVDEDLLIELKAHVRHYKKG